MFDFKDLNFTWVKAVYGKDFDMKKYQKVEGDKTITNIPEDIIAKHTLRIQFDFSKVADIKTFVENSLKSQTTVTKQYYNNYLRNGSESITEKEIAELYARNPIKVDVQNDLYSSSKKGQSADTVISNSVQKAKQKGASKEEIAEMLRAQLKALEE